MKKKNLIYLLTALLVFVLLTAFSSPYISSGELTDTEIEGLLFMREEEKLARDVYLKLADLWGLQVFSNIAQSEESHTLAVLSILTRYGLEDPAAGLDVGEFVNPDLQSLYNDLVAEGSKSLEAALRVGAAIEEIDILDLQEYIANTDKDDLIAVYSNLLSGSENHLRAFVSSLQNQTGESYAPQFLSDAEYSRIISSSGSQGNGKSPGGGKGGNGKGGSL